jgi:hypothetical protein
MPEGRPLTKTIEKRFEERINLYSCKWRHNPCQVLKSIPINLISALLHQLIIFHPEKA